METVAVSVPDGWAQVKVKLLTDTVGTVVLDCTVVVTAELLQPLLVTTRVYVPAVVVVKVCKAEVKPPGPVQA